MTHFHGLEVELTRVIAMGFQVHAFHQEGILWHCRLKILNNAMDIPRYASGDDPYPAGAVRAALENVKAVMDWRPTLGTITRLKALKPDLEALLKEI